MKVLITGIAGFIGSHLAERLLAEGHEVYGIDNLSTGSAENVPVGAHWWVTNVEETNWPVPVDVIYHLAASYRDPKDWERDARVNVIGTIAAVRAAQRMGARLVYAQTSLCYGPHPVSPILTSDPIDPHGSYAISKTAGESYIFDSGVDYVSLRLANMYGPRNLSGPAPAFYKRLAAGEPCTVVDARRDFVFIGDAVEVFAAAKDTGSGVYHVASGTDQSVAEVYAAVRAAMGLAPEEPTLVERGSDDVATLLLDPWDTFVDFGWKASTPLADGIAQTVAWYRDHGVRATYTHLTVKG